MTIKECFRPPSGNEFKNFAEVLCIGVLYLSCFRPPATNGSTYLVRGMSLKTGDDFKFNIDLDNPFSSPCDQREHLLGSGNEFKNYLYNAMESNIRI